MDLYGSLVPASQLDCVHHRRPRPRGLPPEYDYEGANLPNIPSSKGSANGPVNQLRDPFVFADGDDCYVFYAAAGETSIAAARVDDRFCFARRRPRSPQ